MITLKDIIDDFICKSNYECVITKQPYYKTIMKKQSEAQANLLKAIQDGESKEIIEDRIEKINDSFLAANEMYRYFDIKTAFEAGILIGIEAGQNQNNDLFTKINKLLKD